MKNLATIIYIKEGDFKKLNNLVKDAPFVEIEGNDNKAQNLRLEPISFLVQPIAPFVQQVVLDGDVFNYILREKFIVRI